MSHKSGLNIPSWVWLCLLLLCASAPRALAQQSAPKPAATPLTPSQATPSRDVPAARVSQTPIDSSIPDDPAVDQMLVAYAPKVRTLETVIGRLKGELRKGDTGAGSLGNFVADGMRAQASLKLGRPIDLAFVNSGGLRRITIGEGELRARDIFELLPFENALVTLDLNGEQLLRLLQLITTSREAQAGARIVYVIKADKSSHLEKAALRDATGREKEIDPQAIYTIVTIDYLVSVGGRYLVLREGKNLNLLGITLRDAIMAYVKSETAAARDIQPNLDERFSLDRTNSVITEEPPPQ